MLLSCSVFDAFIHWCHKNDMVVKEHKKGTKIKIKVFDVSFELNKTDNGYEIDENSTIWINYKSNYFLPGIQLKKNKADKLFQHFPWDKYKFARLFYNPHSNTWGLYGTCMEDREIIFRKVCNVAENRLVGAFGEDWEEKYWEIIYQ